MYFKKIIKTTTKYNSIFILFTKVLNNLTMTIAIDPSRSITTVSPKFLLLFDEFEQKYKYSAIPVNEVELKWMFVRRFLHLQFIYLYLEKLTWTKTKEKSVQCLSNPPHLGYLNDLRTSHIKDSYIWRCAPVRV